jgi:2-amino-4-hydroxy-6-hydroxymethyldihydropteridine diphosphokinase
MAKLTTAYIGLGSNLGDRENYIRKAAETLGGTDDTKLSRLSALIETDPLGHASQPKYLNAVAEIKTALDAEALHRRLIDIENSLGRNRGGEKWQPRTIDLDLLLFGQDIINRADLVVPHPQLHFRCFVLKGLCELDAKLLHPVIKETVSELEARLGGNDFVPNPDVPQLVSFAGVIGVGKTTLAKKLSDILGCKILLEPYDKNPFLPEVYAGKKEFALDSQLFFLTGRAEQLSKDVLEKGKIYISDYVFDKERIYANRLLNARQLSLYKEIYPTFAARIVAPVLVIYPVDSVQSCLERIHKRNRPYEQKIEPKFLQGLSDDYDRLLSDWKTCPVIRISMSDYMEDSGVEHLANQIKCYAAI